MPPTTPNDKVSKTGVVIDGYVDLANWWIAAWSEHAKVVFAKIEQGNYATSDVTDAMTQAGKLAYETMLRGTVEYYDAMAVYASNLGNPDIETSTEYTTAGSTGERTFRPVQPWTAQGGTEVLPADTTFQFLPSKLFDGQTRFRFWVTASDDTDAGIYEGNIEIVDTDGNVVETILDAEIDV
jgi:hypothetical protein